MLRRLTTHVKLLLDIASSFGRGSSPTARASPIAALEMQEIYKMIDLPSLLCEAVDIAQGKITKVLQIRSEQSTHLSLPWFLRYFTLNLHFVTECESISARNSTTLQTLVDAQVKDFVQLFVDVEMQKLARGMESDQWEAVDFSEKNTAELNRILSGSTKDPDEWLNVLKIWIPYSCEEFAFIDTDDSQPAADGKLKARKASIGEEIFVLPNSAILCMGGLSRFLKMIVGIPSMALDFGASLVSYFQLFDSRCTQLILGAGARQSAGLKNITSKHLVLASQALAFIETLISQAREFVRRHLGRAAAAVAASSVAEFDKVKLVYHEHQNRIYDKIVDIMSRLAESHVKSMKSIDWDNGRKGVHSYMESLTKDTISLHRILTKNLPEATVGMLMTRVFNTYMYQFGNAFQELDPQTELGWDRYINQRKAPAAYSIC